MDAISLQILLRENSRTSQGIAEVAQQLTHLGLDVTASGLATLSARASAESFERLFGHSERDEDRALPIPVALRDSIASITIAPKPILMHRPDREGGSP
jgi:hypothetical protein